MVEIVIFSYKEKKNEKIGYLRYLCVIPVAKWSFWVERRLLGLNRVISDWLTDWL